MKNSMYKGSIRFDREQLVFVVETILVGALDRVEQYLPTSVPRSDALRVRATALEDNCIAAPLEVAGMSLGVLYAQLTGDGLGIYDALSVAGDFHKVVELMAAMSWQDDGAHVYAAMDARQRYRVEDVLPVYPRTRAHAEMFVSRLFADYLRGGRSDFVVRRRDDVEEDATREPEEAPA